MKLCEVHMEIRCYHSSFYRFFLFWGADTYRHHCFFPIDIGFSVHFNCSHIWAANTWQRKDTMIPLMLCVKHFRICTYATETESTQTCDTRFFFLFLPKVLFSLFYVHFYHLSFKGVQTKGSRIIHLYVHRVSLTMPSGFKINSPQDGASELHSLLLFLDLLLNEHTHDATENIHQINHSHIDY